MRDVAVLVFGFLIATVVTELSLKGTKVQTGFAKVLVIHAMFAMGTMAYLLSQNWRILLIPFFWGGAFLTWFGIRSHVESSILLRMLYLLREHPMTANELLQSYESHYGKADRVDELLRGGLVERKGEQIAVSAKGNVILLIVSFLK